MYIDLCRDEMSTVSICFSVVGRIMVSVSKISININYIHIIPAPFSGIKILFRKSTGHRGKCVTPETQVVAGNLNCFNQFNTNVWQFINNKCSHLR